MCQNSKQCIFILLCISILLASCGNQEYPETGKSWLQKQQESWREDLKIKKEEFAKREKEGEESLKKINDPVYLKQEQEQREEGERRIQKEWVEWSERTFGKPVKEESEEEKKEREIRKKRGEDWLREGAEQFKKEQEERNKK